MQEVRKPKKGQSFGSGESGAKCLNRGSRKLMLLLHEDWSMRGLFFHDKAKSLLSCFTC